MAEYKRQWNRKQQDAFKTLKKYSNKISRCEFKTLFGVINEGRETEALKGLRKILLRNQRRQRDGQGTVPAKAAETAREAAQEQICGV